MLYQNRQFTYAQVVSMTNNFEKSIGRGGFGTVYHGQMTNGTQVAVKMLFLRSIKTPCQGSNEFENEVRLNHCLSQQVILISFQREMLDYQFFGKISVEHISNYLIRFSKALSLFLMGLTAHYLNGDQLFFM